jgi:hypothetical protein
VLISPASPEDDILQTSKSIDGSLKYFFRKKLYIMKQFENLHVCMHHGPAWIHEFTWFPNDVYNLFVNTHVRIKIYRGLHQYSQWRASCQNILISQCGKFILAKFKPSLLSYNLVGWPMAFVLTWRPSLAILMKPTIYFNSHMRIDEQIINIIPKWIHVFIQDRGAYKHKNYRIVIYL